MSERLTAQPSTEVSNTALAKDGADWFIAASIKYPASVTCQAASIALTMQREGTDARRMQVAMTLDTNAKDRIFSAANKMHEKHRLPPVDPDHGESVITKVFRNAQWLSPLDPFDLRSLLSMYEAGDGTAKELEKVREMYRLLKQHQLISKNKQLLLSGQTKPHSESLCQDRLYSHQTKALLSRHYQD